MRQPRPVTLFSAAVAVAVVALGVAWATWPLVSTAPLALLAAIPATLAFAGATAVAGRIITLMTRAADQSGDPS